MKNLKQSGKIYRNIAGVSYLQFTSDPGEFSKIKAQAKEKGIKCRILKGEELLIEAGRESEIK